MPKFDTPEPIHLLIDVGGGSLAVRALDDAHSATVDVAPHNPASAADVGLAQRTVVDLAGGRLTIRATRSTKAKLRSLFGASERIDIAVTVPAGTSLEVQGWGDISTEGTLGTVDIDSAMGDVTVDRAGGVQVRTAMGEIRVASAAGAVDLHSSMGSITVEDAQSTVRAKTSTGDVRVEQAKGDVTLSTSAGDVRMHRALAGVDAKTSAGNIRLNSVCSGIVTARTTYGQLEIGVAHGTAAWLDVDARHGALRSSLESTDGPGDSELTVKIHAVTGYGDIVLRRA